MIRLLVLVVLVLSACTPPPPIPVKFAVNEIARFQSCTRLGDVAGQTTFLTDSDKRVAVRRMRQTAFQMGATHVNIMHVSCGMGTCVAGGDAFKCETDVGGIGD